MKHSNSFNLQLIPYNLLNQFSSDLIFQSDTLSFSSLYSSVFISSPPDIFLTICGRIFPRKKLIKISPACNTPNPSQRPTDPPTWFVIFMAVSFETPLKSVYFTSERKLLRVCFIISVLVTSTLCTHCQLMITISMYTAVHRFKRK